MIIWPNERVCITGGAGFLGRSVCRVLTERGLPESQRFVPRRREYDLTREADVERLYADARPTIVIHLAAEVGGIGANMEQPGRFFYANMAMGLHLIEHARRRELKRFVQVGTVCAYPRLTEVPFQESSLHDGYPEATNAPYGIAKRSLLVMLDAYRRQYGLRSVYLLPTNLYGPHDNFDPRTSHVIPALIRKIEQARCGRQESVECWGSGMASRDFLFVDDAAEGIVRTAERIETPEPINLGSGRETTIRELAERIRALCGYEGYLDWDISKPDGQPRRCLDISQAVELLGWRPRVDLEDGLRATIDWWRNQESRD